MPRVNVAPDDIERFAQCKPAAAIEELIWNGLDAGGTRLEVAFEKREAGDVLKTIDAIEIVDFGEGIPLSALKESFGHVGGSSKASNRFTPEGRVRHGRFGRGRFTFLVLGSLATWTTTYRDAGKLWTYSITVNRERPDFYDKSVPVESDSHETGTTLRISRLTEGARTLLASSTVSHLLRQLACYLFMYPNVEVTFDGDPLDVKASFDLAKQIRFKGKEVDSPSAEITIIEWKAGTRTDSSKLVLCDERHFALTEIPAGVPLGEINASAYLTSSEFGRLSESGELGMAEMSPTVAELAKLARKKLRTYIRSRVAERSGSLVAQWQGERIYPYKGEPQGFAEQVERQVFDILASQIHQFHPPFRKSTRQTRQLTLQLVRQALESKPTAVYRIISEVLKLPQKRQTQLASMIDRAGLDALIEANSTVLDRLDTVEVFRHILFNKDWREKLRERTQLHRLLVHELWIFGDEYTLDTDDEPLRKVLEAHISHLGRDRMVPSVDLDKIDVEEKIPDLMLSRRIRRDRELVEHLVLELKNPRVKADEREVSQVEKVARLVSSSEAVSRNPSHVKWTFILLVNEIGDYGAYRLKNAPVGGGPGCIAKSEGFEIRIQCWNEVLHDAQLRYEFFKDAMKVEPTADIGMKRFLKLYGHLMQGKGMSKRGEIESGKLTDRRAEEK